jgi:hypothetical protein
MTRDNFICKVVQECIKNGITLKIIQKEFVGKDRYSGWFDPTKKELVCAYKNLNGFTVLVHEYNHMLQWKNRKEFWNKCGQNDESFLFDWIAGKEMSASKVTRILKKTIRLERDCEIRTLKTFKKYKLDVDLEHYIRQANVYIYSYWFIRKYRKWPSMKIYSKSFLDQMPNEFLPLHFYLNGLDKSGNKVIVLYEKFLSIS